MDRAYLSTIQEFLSLFPCVVLLGPRQCGKTTLSKKLGGAWRHFDLENTGDFEQVKRNPDLFFRLYPEKVVIDEAQLMPELFNALRVTIDNDRGKAGRFLLTGSSSPELVSTISESLAGRVGIIEMAPLSCLEAGGHLDFPLLEILNNKKNAFAFAVDLPERASIDFIHSFWLRGGFPEPWLKNTDRFHRLWMQNYFDTFVLRDLSRLFPRIDARRYRNFIGLLAGLSGCILNYSDLARDLEVSQTTIKEYIHIAHGTFLWRTLPAFSRQSKKRLVKHPKGHLRDAGLLHHLSHIITVDALLQHPLMGRSWEAFVIEEISKGLSARGAAVEASYWRTSAGVEVDLVLEGDFGIVPFEIKYGRDTPLGKLNGLRAFMEEYACPLGIVIHNEKRVSMPAENILGIPFNRL